MARRTLCPLLWGVVLFWLTGLPTRMAQADAILLVNGGFEEGNFSPTGTPTGWSTAQYTPGHAQFTWDNTQAHSGSKSVKISATQPDDARWLQVVNVQPNTYYELSGWIRTENVPSGSGGANLSVESNSSPFLARGKRTGTADWRRVRAIFDSGTATQVTIAARLGDYGGVTTGTAWFDDLELRPIILGDFKVIPVLFRPNDAPPIAHALPWIDTQMQRVQQWYGEQLRDRTFRLEAARTVVGTYPRVHYYGTCYPLGEGCVPDWGQQLFDNIFADLEMLDYPNRPDQVVVAFFQSEGGRAAALGGGGRALVGLPPENLISDNTHISSHFMVDLGGMAHELGHGFGLPHTEPDPEGSHLIALMLLGFQTFPQTTLVNTAINPERADLRATRFFTNTLLLTDGGFEDCLAAWKVTKGAPTCVGGGQQRSGLSALRFSAANSQYALEQDTVVSATTVYDFAGWLQIDAPASGGAVEVAVQALSQAKNVLSTFAVQSFNRPTAGWQRFAATLPMPANAAFARVKLSAQGQSLAVWLDDLVLRQATQPPQTPLPVFYNDGQAVADLQPKLQWSDVVQATAYQVQIATNPEFTPLLGETQVASPFLIATLPAFDTYYFWRVRAINGSGASAWSPVWSLVPRRPDRFYNDEFESGVLASPWVWHSTPPAQFEFMSPPNRRGGYLAIKSPFGNLDVAGAPRHLLLRPTPPGDFEVNTFSESWKHGNNPNWQGIHEERGLLLYQDDDNYIRLGQGYQVSYQLSLVAKVGGIVAAQANIPRALPLPLKLVRQGNTYRAYYTVDGIAWRLFGQPITTQWSNVRMGLYAYHALADANPSVAYFNRFRVANPCYTVTTTVVHSVGGSVQQSPETCASGGYRGEAPVTFTATAAPGYHFGGWQGDIAGQTNPLTLPVTGDWQISAIFYTYGVEAAPSLTQAGDPGTTVVYALPVRNLGNTPDSYVVAVSNQQWHTSVPAIIGPLEPNASGMLTIAVQIPAAALAGASDVATLVLTSQGDPSRSVTSTLATMTNPSSGVAMTVDSNTQSAAPQTSVVYSVTVTNLGNSADSFTLTHSGNQWPVTLPATVGPLPAGQSVLVSVMVTIPPGIAAGASDGVLVTVSSQRDPGQAASLSLTTRATVVTGLAAVVAQPRQAAAAGDTISYQVQVTNQGNSRTSFTVQAVAVWSVTAPSLVGPLDPGSSTSFTVRVQVPLTAGATASDICQLTLAAQDAPAQMVTVQLETVVTGQRLFLPILAQGVGN